MTSKLSLYQQKRDFTKTAEPRGSANVTAAEYPRFVVQKLAATRLHYNLRLEVHGVFKSWAVTRGFSLGPKEKRLAVETEDHPAALGTSTHLHRCLDSQSRDRATLRLVRPGAPLDLLVSCRAAGEHAFAL